MTIYHTYIDDNIGLGSSTIAQIQTNGSTYGVGISSNGHQVSTGTTTGMGTYYPTFVDSNNSTRENEFLYTDAGISYNRSTNLLSVNGIIESSNDNYLGANEGGQFVLRGKSGTSSRWCIDNHTNAGNTVVNQFRIFREDDATSANGLAYVGITTIGEFIIESGGSLLPTGTPNQQFQLQSGAYISGNLGIGITIPTSKLHTVHNNNDIGLSTGSIPLSPGIILQNSGGDAALWLGNDNRVSAGLGILVNNGSVIDFSGKYSVIDTYGSLTFGRIGAFKENNTSNDFSGYLSLYSRSTAGSLVESLRIDSSQRVGIGITNPTSKLHVSGNVTVTGSVSKGSGSFVIDHPLNETKNLVHSFIEGPRADLIYRGTVSIIDGSATINLDEEYELIPGTWKALCRNPQVWISNIDGWTKCRGNVEDGILIIEAQTASNESVNWLVIAERKDKHMYDTEWTDDNGRPILEPVKL